MTTVEYGLRDLESHWQRAGVLTLVSEVISDVRRRNADRQEPALGDDAMSQGMLNWRNIGNRLEKRVAELPGLRVIRPQNSLQLLVERHAVSVYGLSSADPQSIKWNGSGMKSALARANSAVVGDGPLQYSLFDETSANMVDDGARLDDDVLQPANVCFAHWASPDGQSVRIWMGFPRDNSRGGSPWLEVLELELGESAPKLADKPVTSTPLTTYLEGTMPDVEITWRKDKGQAPGAPIAQ